MLDKDLDVVKLIHQGRTFKTLLRLLLTGKERQLIRFQRHEAVLDLNYSNRISSNEDVSDSQLLDKIRKSGELATLTLSQPAQSFSEKLLRGAIYKDWSAQT